MKHRYGWCFPDADEFMIKELGSDGTYQASHLALALGHVTDHRCAIDGGAHVGTWARLLSAAFTRVIAVEPSADTYEALVANMAAFGCTNVETRPIALGAAPGRVNMILDGRAAALKNTGGRYSAQAPSGRVACEPIDAWNLPALGFLKLDVEGAEFDALQGAAATIRRCRPIVLFEDKGLWKRLGLQRDAPHNFLTDLGYRHLLRASMDEIWGPR